MKLLQLFLPAKAAPNVAQRLLPRRRVSGLTVGTTYFLDTTDGQITATPPSATGNLLQAVGQALTSTALFFLPQIGIRRR